MYNVNTFELSNDIAISQDMNEDERIVFLECLINVSKMCKTQTKYTALNYAGGNFSILKQRFDIILNYRRKNNNLLTYVNTFLVVLLFILSFTFVFEPYILPQDVAKDSVEFSQYNTYLVKGIDSENNVIYDVYYDGKYFATTQNIDGIFSDFTIYNNLNEVKYDK